MNRTKPHQSPAARAVPRPTVRPPISQTNGDVALADITDVCALSRMSPSWVWDEVKEGRLPAPVIRLPRCTRWRLADVRAWLIEWAAAAQVSA